MLKPWLGEEEGADPEGLHRTERVGAGAMCGCRIGRRYATRRISREEQAHVVRGAKALSTVSRCPLHETIW